MGCSSRCGDPPCGCSDVKDEPPNWVGRKGFGRSSTSVYQKTYRRRGGGQNGEQGDPRSGAGAKEKAPGSGLFSTPGRPGSIVGAEAFHFRVRDGNGWGRLALATRSQFYAVVEDGGWRSENRSRRPASIVQHPASTRVCVGSGGGTRTHDLRVMSPASCRCSTPRRVAKGEG